MSENGNGNGNGERSVYVLDETLRKVEVLDALDIPVVTAWPGEDNRGVRLPSARESWQDYNQLLDTIHSAETDDLYAAALKKLALRIRPHPQTGCWVWHGYLHEAEYGYHAKPPIEGLTHAAHKQMYQILKGQESIPGSYHLDHLCRNRRCCNPKHLEPVHPDENTRRIIPAARVENIIQSEDQELAEMLITGLIMQNEGVVASKAGATRLFPYPDRRIEHTPWDRTSGPDKVMLVQYNNPFSGEKINARPSTLPAFSLVTLHTLPSAYESTLLFIEELTLTKGQQSLFTSKQEAFLPQYILEDININPRSGCWETRLALDTQYEITGTCLNYNCVCPLHKPPDELNYVELIDAYGEGLLLGRELLGYRGAMRMPLELAELDKEGAFVLTFEQGPVHSREFLP